MWIIWVVAVLYGTSGAILPSASSALQRSIVPDDLLADAQGVQQSVATVLQLIAPIAGAALYAAWGGAGTTVPAAASFIAGAMVFTRFREPPAQARRGEDTNLWSEMSAGIRHVLRTKPLLDAVVALWIVEAVGGLLDGAMYSVTDTFHRPVAWATSVAAAQSVGMIVGALGSASLVRLAGERRAMTLSLASSALGACAAAPTIWVLLVIVTVLGTMLPVVLVASGTLQQRLTPAALMGRVSAAVTACSRSHRSPRWRRGRCSSSTGASVRCSPWSAPAA